MNDGIRFAVGAVSLFGLLFLMGLGVFSLLGELMRDEWQEGFEAGQAEGSGMITEEFALLVDMPPRIMSLKLNGELLLNLDFLCDQLK